MLSLFPFLWGQLSEVWKLMSWLQSGHNVFFGLLWPFSFLSARPQFSDCTYSLAKVFPQTKDGLRTWQWRPRTIGSCSVTDVVVVAIQSLSRVQLFATPWATVHQVLMPSTISQNFFKFMSIELVRPSNHLILGCSLLLFPSIFPSIRVFSSESVLCIR